MWLSSVIRRFSRQSLRAWLTRYEAEGLAGLADRSHRPVQCPHQMPAVLEARVLEMRRSRRYWGPRRIMVELARAGVDPLPSESAVYRCLVRAGVIAPVRRQRRSEAFKRWERAAPMELWQMDVVGGFHLADGTSAKALTGIDDHSRFCVSARLMPRERRQTATAAAERADPRYGRPNRAEVLMTGSVEVSLTIAAPPETVYGLVADLARMGEWSPETTENRWLDGATQAQVGARFRGTNRNGFRRWNTICTVVTAQPGIELSWRSSSFGLSVAQWTYHFTPDGEGGTTVTESTQDDRGSLMRLIAPLATGVRDRAGHNGITMLATLHRLKAEAERTST